MAEIAEKWDFPKIIAECDRLFNRGDNAGVETLQLSLLQLGGEAGDSRLQLFIESELMGHYRMKGDHKNSQLAVERGLQLLSQMPELDPTSTGTILINAGTALSASGNFDAALELYLQTAQYYAETLKENDPLWAGLFNNMASVYSAKEDIVSAEKYYLEALDILNRNPQSADIAVSCINLAQLYAANDPNDPMIEIMLSTALDCFNSPTLPRNGYYAHSCLKCASAFGFFGHEDIEAELKSRAKEIYERN